MKTIKIFTQTVIMFSVSMLLSACGGGSTDWGIDHGKNDIPQCAIDSRDASAAVKVPAGTEIKALTEDTTMRVWHYDNADKMVCILTGDALFSEGKQNESK